MIKFWRVSLSLLVAVMLSGAVAAQEPEPSQPRLLLMSAVRDEQFITGLDLYRLNGDSWEAVTTDGYKGGFALSPSGFIMAYLSVPEALRPVLEGGAGWLAGAVWDLRLLDLTTDTSRTIAAQPPEFVVDADGQITNGITRSTPVWSPEGTALAWTEQDYPAVTTARLMVYDLISGETRTLDEALPQVTMSEDGLPTDVSWGDAGLVVFANDPETGVETLRFYDPEIGLQQIVAAANAFGEAWLPVVGPFWASFEGAGEQAVVQAGPWQWWRVDPVAAEVTAFCGVIEQVSASNPETSLRLVWDTARAQTDEEWTLAAADGMTVTALDASRAQRVVLSPQGERAAWPEAAEIQVYDEGEITTVELPAGLSNPVLYWGPAAWRMESMTGPECVVG